MNLQKLPPEENNLLWAFIYKIVQISKKRTRIRIANTHEVIINVSVVDIKHLHRGGNLNLALPDIFLRIIKKDFSYTVRLLMANWKNAWEILRKTLLENTKWLWEIGHCLCKYSETSVRRLSFCIDTLAQLPIRSLQEQRDRKIADASVVPNIQLVLTLTLILFILLIKTRKRHSCFIRGYDWPVIALIVLNNYEKGVGII